LRNIAIVAHVDHGKTTLVDALLKQANILTAKSAERVMDSNDQEKERGITILAKNAAITYKGTKINLVDTPGHADFGGEVERVLNMVDGVLLVVDSVEGPRPQTRFVLRKALERDLRAVVVVNKIDRAERREAAVVEKTFELFCDLNADDDQADFPVVYTSAIKGVAGTDAHALEENMDPLFEAILGLPRPRVRAAAPLQLLIANIAYDQFKGKLGIGRIQSGTLSKGDPVGFMKPGEKMTAGKISELFVFDELGRTEVDTATAGDIVMIAGLEKVGIGCTVVDPDEPDPLPPIKVEEPTVKMTFMANKSPFAGKDKLSRHLTSNAILERLRKELDVNVALQVAQPDPSNTELFQVSGRGEMHLTVLIETMRREGFELLVGPPSVITREVDGRRREPFELLDVQVDPDLLGNLISILTSRKGQVAHVEPENGSGMTEASFLIPTRGMIGLRSQILTATRGTAVMDSVFHSYQPYAGEIESREKGSLTAHSTGTVTTYGVIGAQERGSLFVSPKDEVYEGMVIGIHQRPGDLAVNVCKQKQLDNMRSANKDQTEGVVPPIQLSLDQAIEYIQDDELVEVTPSKIRILKNPSKLVKARRKK